MRDPANLPRINTGPLQLVSRTLGAANPTETLRLNLDHALNTKHYNAATKLLDNCNDTQARELMKQYETASDLMRKIILSGSKPLLASILKHYPSRENKEDLYHLLIEGHNTCLATLILAGSSVESIALIIQELNTNNIDGFIRAACAKSNPLIARIDGQRAIVEIVKLFPEEIRSSLLARPRNHSLISQAYLGLRESDFFSELLEQVPTTDRTRLMNDLGELHSRPDQDMRLIRYLFLDSQAFGTEDYFHYESMSELIRFLHGLSELAPAKLKDPAKHKAYLMASGLFKDHEQPILGRVLDNRKQAEIIKSTKNKNGKALMQYARDWLKNVSYHASQDVLARAERLDARHFAHQQPLTAQDYTRLSRAYIQHFEDRAKTATLAAQHKQKYINEYEQRKSLLVNQNKETMIDELSYEELKLVSNRKAEPVETLRAELGSLTIDSLRLKLTAFYDNSTAELEKEKKALAQEAKFSAGKAQEIKALDDNDKFFQNFPETIAYMLTLNLAHKTARILDPKHNAANPSEVFFNLLEFPQGSWQANYHKLNAYNDIHISSISDTVKVIAKYLILPKYIFHRYPSFEERNKLETLDLLAMVEHLLKHVTDKMFTGHNLHAVLGLSRSWHLEAKRVINKIRDVQEGEKIWHTPFDRFEVKEGPLKGYSVVALNSNAAMRNESKKMGNCVEGYSQDCSSGRLVVCSVRNNYNECICSFQLLTPRMHQGRAHGTLVEIHGHKGVLALSRFEGPHHTGAGEAAMATIGKFQHAITAGVLKLELDKFGIERNQSPANAFEDVIGYQELDLETAEKKLSAYFNERFAVIEWLKAAIDKSYAVSADGAIKENENVKMPEIARKIMYAILHEFNDIFTYLGKQDTGIIGSSRAKAIYAELWQDAYQKCCQVREGTAREIQRERLGEILQALRRFKHQFEQTVRYNKLNENALEDLSTTFQKDFCRRALATIAYDDRLRPMVFDADMHQELASGKGPSHSRTIKPLPEEWLKELS